MLALTASPAGELTVYDTVIRLEELLDRLGANLAAPVQHLQEVGEADAAGAVVAVDDDVDTGVVVTAVLVEVDDVRNVISRQVYLSCARISSMPLLLRCPDGCLPLFVRTEHRNTWNFADVSLT